jgi:hypothetical protein
MINQGKNFLLPRLCRLPQQHCGGLCNHKVILYFLKKKYTAAAAVVSPDQPQGVITFPNKIKQVLIDYTKIINNH